MAQRIENECAYCAELIEPEKGIVGKDWKVYCSISCVEAGELISIKDWNQLMRNSTPSRDQVIQEPGQ